LTTSKSRLLQKLKALGDGRVAGIELSSLGTGVDGVVDLVVATLIQGPKVELDFRDIGVGANGAGVGIKGVAVLVDLEVENTNRAPEHGLAGTLRTPCCTWIQPYTHG
jgi:hypothetical protein